jgi:hypothetical protein
MMISQRLVCRTPTKMREEHRRCALIRCYAFRNNSGSLAIFTAIYRASSLLSSFAAEIAT